MKKSLFIGILVLIASLSTVQAHDCSFAFDASSTTEFFAGITDLNGQLQTCPQDLPAGVDTLYQDEEIELRVTAESELVAHAVIAESHVTSIASGASQDPDYIVTISSTDFDTFLASDDKGATFLSLYNDDKIDINPQGVLNNIVYFITWIGSWFA